MEAIISHHAHQRPIQQLSGDDDWGPADDGDEALIVGNVFGFGNHKTRFLYLADRS